MKTFLVILALAGAVGTGTTLALETAGLSVPAGIDPARTFVAFVVAVVLLTFVGDYSRRSAVLVESQANINSSAPSAEAKADHPLAA